MSDMKLVAAVVIHAEQNYDKGWDVVVECWTEQEIADYIKGARTVPEALAMFKPVVNVYAERQADADYHRRQAIGGGL